QGHARVGELQHLLLCWELLGETHRAAFVDATHAYVRFYLDHMKVEEMQLLPAAVALGTADRAQLDAAFGANLDPLGPDGHQNACERLFTRIVTHAPAPNGVGPAWTGGARPAERRTHAPCLARPGRPLPAGDQHRVLV